MVVAMALTVGRGWGQRPGVGGGVGVAAAAAAAAAVGCCPPGAAPLGSASIALHKPDLGCGGRRACLLGELGRRWRGERRRAGCCEPGGPASRGRDDREGAGPAEPVLLGVLSRAVMRAPPSPPVRNPAASHRASRSTRHRSITSRCASWDSLPPAATARGSLQGRASLLRAASVACNARGGSPGADSGACQAAPCEVTRCPCLLCCFLKRGVSILLAWSMCGRRLTQPGQRPPAAAAAASMSAARFSARALTNFQSLSLNASPRAGCPQQRPRPAAAAPAGASSRHAARRGPQPDGQGAPG